MNPRSTMLEMVQRKPTYQSKPTIYHAWDGSKKTHLSEWTHDLPCLRWFKENPLIRVNPRSTMLEMVQRKPTYQSEPTIYHAWDGSKKTHLSEWTHDLPCLRWFKENPLIRVNPRSTMLEMVQRKPTYQSEPMIYHAWDGSKKTHLSEWTHDLPCLRWFKENPLIRVWLFIVILYVSINSYKWYIPFTYITEDNPDPTNSSLVWLKMDGGKYMNSNFSL